MSIDIFHKILAHEPFHDNEEDMTFLIVNGYLTYDETLPVSEIYPFSYRRTKDFNWRNLYTIQTIRSKRYITKQTTEDLSKFL